MDYEHLKYLYNSAVTVCDPIEYANRQKQLLYGIAHYIFQKDEPVKDDEEDDDG